jgi:hypothetical protein
VRKLRLLRALQQEVVGLGGELIARADVRGIHASDNNDRERDGDYEREANPQHHDVRTL